MTEKRRIAFLFPGQGAQYVGMGHDFCRDYPAARQLFEEADDLLKRSLSHLIFSGQERELTQTRNSQPAIYVTSMAILAVLSTLFDTLSPYACAGLSLGEYSALTAAQFLPFTDGLNLVAKRGELMHQACEQHEGTMAVVLGMQDDAVVAVVEALALPDEIWAANFNCPGQVVISGTKRGVEQATATLLKHGAKRVLPLDVHGAFHSGLMQSAQEKLTDTLLKTPFSQSDVLVPMNCTGKIATSIEEMRENLIRQVTRPVYWHKCVAAIDTVDLFVEIGCGKTLSGMNKRIGVKTATCSVEKIEDLAILEQALRTS